MYYLTLNYGHVKITEWSKYLIETLVNEVIKAAQCFFGHENIYQENLRQGIRQEFRRITTTVIMRGLRTHEPINSTLVAIRLVYTPEVVV
jgi:hypothetical protein